MLEIKNIRRTNSDEEPDVWEKESDILEDDEADEEDEDEDEDEEKLDYGDGDDKEESY